MSFQSICIVARQRSSYFTGERTFGGRYKLNTRPILLTCEVKVEGNALCNSAYECVHWKGLHPEGNFSKVTANCFADILHFFLPVEDNFNYFLSFYPLLPLFRRMTISLFWSEKKTVNFKKNLVPNALYVFVAVFGLWLSALYFVPSMFILFFFAYFYHRYQIYTALFHNCKVK